MPNSKEIKEKVKLIFFEFFVELIGWIQIMASPFLAGLIIGFIFFLTIPGVLGLSIGIIIAFIGLIVGVLFATKVWKKTGTMHFMSRTMASPELDKLEEN